MNLEESYNHYIEHIFKQKLAIGEIVWLNVYDIKPRFEKEPMEIQLTRTDSYLNSGFDLKKDIVENGTFWPFLTYIENGEEILIDGHHRYHCLMELHKEGKWNKKVMVYRFDNKPNLFLEEVDDKDIKKIEPIKFLLPYDLYFSNQREPKQIALIEKYAFPQKGYKWYNDELIEFIADDERKFWFVNKSYVTLLREKLFKYPDIKPHRLVNEENDYFQKT